MPLTGAEVIEIIVENAGELAADVRKLIEDEKVAVTYVDKVKATQAVQLLGAKIADLVKAAEAS